jgi:CAAX protease family protein
LIWLFALLLVVWGNVVSSLLGATARLPGGSAQFVNAGVVLVVLSIGVALSLGLSRSDLGLGPGAARGALVGGALAAVVALAGVAIVRLAAPAVVGVPVDYAPLQQVTADALATHLVIFLPFGAVIPEELAFRGVLLGALARARGSRDAVIGSSAAFALWHGAVALVTISDTSLGPPSPWFVPAAVAALLVVFGGGVAFAILRLRSGTLATTIAAHWVFNAVVLLGLWATRHPTTHV